MMVDTPKVAVLFGFDANKKNRLDTLASGGYPGGGGYPLARARARRHRIPSYPIQGLTNHTYYAKIPNPGEALGGTPRRNRLHRHTHARGPVH